MVKFVSKVSFRKYLITAMFKVLFQQLPDTLTVAYERHSPVEDFTDAVVEAVPRHLTYCSMLFFLSNKPSFCYSSDFWRNLFTFLCLKKVPPLINFSNVFQPEHSYSNPNHPHPPSPPSIFHKTLENISPCWRGKLLTLMIFSNFYMVSNERATL